MIIALEENISLLPKANSTLRNLLVLCSAEFLENSTRRNFTDQLNPQIGDSDRTHTDIIQTKSANHFRYSSNTDDKVSITGLADVLKFCFYEFCVDFISSRTDVSEYGSV